MEGKGVMDFPVSPNASDEHSGLLRTALHSFQDENTWETVQITVANSQKTSYSSSVPKLRILIAATWRTGSTFLGELLNKYPGTFYSFEPMHFIDRNRHINGGVQAQRSVRLLSSLFRCSFAEQLPYIAHCMNPDFRFLFRHNQRLWSACQSNEAFCSDPQFVSSVCQHCQVHLVKSVRLRLKRMEALLKEFGNLRIIWLTRHPGGILASRSKMPWCRHSTCTDPSKVCADLHEDWEAFQNLTQRYPARLYHIKYENLGINTHEEIKKLFKFLVLPDIQIVHEYIESHTKFSESGIDPYGTLRNSKKNVDKWKKNLYFWQKWRIRNGCMSFMNALQY